MTDSLRVHILVKDEVFPRIYEMRGATFDAMKKAAKATGAIYDGNLRSWRLPGPTAWETLKGLREQHTVTETPLVRVQRDRGAVYQPDTHSNMTARPVATELWLEARIDVDFWRRLPPVPVKVEVTAEMEAQASAEMAADGLTAMQIHKFSIGRHCAAAELERMSAAADARVKALLKGKPRTKENYQAALAELLKELGWAG